METSEYISNQRFILRRIRILADELDSLLVGEMTPSRIKHYCAWGFATLAQNEKGAGYDI